MKKILPILAKLIPKTRKNRIILATLLSLVLVFVGNYLGFYRLLGQKAGVFEAVPQKSAFILETYSIKETLAQMGIDNAESPHTHLPFAEMYLSDLHFLDSILQQQSSYQPISKKSHWIAVPLIIKVDAYGLLHAGEGLPSTFDIKTLAYSLKAKEITSTTFKGQEIYHLTYKNGAKGSFTEYKGVLLFSKSSSLVEFGLEQLRNYRTAIVHNKAFAECNKSSGGGDVTLIFQPKKIAYFSSIFTSNLHNPFISLEKFSDWSSLDFTFHPQSVAFTGNLFPDSKNTFLSRLSNASVGNESAIHSHIPENVAILAYFSAPNLQKIAYKSLHGNYSDFEGHILPWISDEMAYVMLEPSSSDTKASTFVIVKAKDGQKAAQALDKHHHKNGSEPALAHHQHIIKRLSVGETFSCLFGKSFSPVSNPYYSVVGEYVIFANSLAGLKIWLDQIGYGQTLSNNPAFANAASKVTFHANLYTFAQPRYCSQVLKSLTREDMMGQTLVAFQHWKNYDAIAISGIGQGGRFNLKGVAMAGKGESKVQSEASIVWRADLGIPAITPPYQVKNHETGQNEVMIQDANFKVYRIGNNGEVRWSKPLDGPILSAIQEADVYGNGRLHTFMNTQEKIYLLDKDGEDVYPPIRVPSKASNGMYAAQLDENGVTFFIGGENGYVYGYSRDGSPLSGWSPQIDINKAVKPLQHFTSGGYDFLVAINKAGELRIVKKGGQLLCKVPFATSYHGTFDIDPVAQRIAIASKNGEIHVSNFKGSSFKLATSVGDNKDVHFAYADVTGDNRKDYVVQSGTKLAIYGYKGTTFSKVSSHEFPEEINDIFPVKSLHSDKWWVGAVANESQRIYVVDGAGKALSGFPLAGDKRFFLSDFYQTQTNVLVSVSGGMVYGYRVGY